MIRPDFDTFCELARDASLVAVSREIPFDTETAITAYARLAAPPFSFLLESVTGGERWARWTFLGTRPREAWKLQHGRVRRWTPQAGWTDDAVDADETAHTAHASRAGAGPLDRLARRLRGERLAAPPGLPPFIGGAVGYLGYDVVRQIERLGEGPPDDLGLPDAILAFTDVVLAIDNVYGCAHVVAVQRVTGSRSRSELRHGYKDALARIDRTLADLHAGTGPEPLTTAPSLAVHSAAARGSSTALGATKRQDAPPAPGLPADLRSTFTRPEFEHAVRRIKEYIAAGDAFQVVLSQRLDVQLASAPFDAYRRLRHLNPSPYMFYLELDGVVLAGASPEVLVRVRDGRATVRPIAGTRHRGRNEGEDARLEAELLADPKERAEHLMLVDLGRNDLGRVCRYGSVQVSDLMSVERYSHVLHMVSQVDGRLREGLDAFDALRAAFPAGTVSGAPKVRAMEIIDELEPARRGPYAGAVGWLGYGGGDMDTAIAIRTLVAAGGRAHVQAGAGVVADSDPAREYAETLAKAGALLSVAAM